MRETGLICLGWKILEEGSHSNPSRLNSTDIKGLIFLVYPACMDRKIGFF